MKLRIKIHLELLPKETDGVQKPVLSELLRAVAVKQCWVLDRTGHKLQHFLDLEDDGSQS